MLCIKKSCCDHSPRSADTIRISGPWSQSVIHIRSHDVAAALILDLQRMEQQDSGEEVTSVTCWWDVNVMKREKRKEKLRVSHVPDILDLQQQNLDLRQTWTGSNYNFILKEGLNLQHADGVVLQNWSWDDSTGEELDADEFWELRALVVIRYYQLFKVWFCHFINMVRRRILNSKCNRRFL